MTLSEQTKAAEKFAEEWLGHGNEKQDTQKFWTSLLRDVFGVEKPEQYISFEKQVYVGNSAKYIDGYIKDTLVVIEQKSMGIGLLDAEKQSDDSLLTPFEQAKRYDGALFYGEHSQYIITCNFQEFYIYDMTKSHKKSEPNYSFPLSDLPKEFPKLQFLVKATTPDISFVKEVKVSKEAGIIVGKLYDALLKQYDNPDDPNTLKSLNALCVRLVFCLYAEDAGLFDTYSAFRDYLNTFNTTHIRLGLSELFNILNTKETERSANIEENLKQFPYVNGGLFEEVYDIPQFNEEIRHILLDEASASFDWSEISPTIFGAVFESTLNPVTRRKGGMHYTSIENIHKIIDPLFLEDLKKELDTALAYKTLDARRSHLKDFIDKISNLTFLDPACGSGNFLTETYICLREMENKALYAITGIWENQAGLQFEAEDEYKSPIKVSIEQFYGIEINDFAVTVAKTALWIAESQMLKKTENIIHKKLDFLPLKTNAHIIEDNALTLEWGEVIPKAQLNYIMGNPPFVGKKYQSKDQKQDMKYVFGAKAKGIGNLDYVTAWYHKAAEFIQNSRIKASFVSTNSIVQGEHIPLLWKPLYDQYYVNIIFAYQTFKWDSEAFDKAAVHCVIIGFDANMGRSQHRLYITDRDVIEVNNIHPYLLELPNILIDNRSKPLFANKPLVYGSFALDDGNYTIAEDEYNELIKKEPAIAKYFKLFIGSEEFINNKKRYCIWLKNADITEIKKSHIICDRVKKVQEWRSKSNRKETAAAADTPMLFAEIRQPESDYMAIPITSSERREYIPMGYMSKEIIASNHLLVLPNASLFDFGILMSSVHMAWTRVVCGRLEMRYNYSARIVYNNFPWPSPTPAQRADIEKTAQSILDARKLYPNYSLADLYDPVFMQPELRKAHKNNDNAVMKAYGFDKDTPELVIVTELLKLYEKKAK